MTVLDGEDIVYVQRVTVRKVMTISLSIGARLPAFCASMGRVLVAALDDVERARWLKNLEPRAFTQFTVTDKGALQRAARRIADSLPMAGTVPRAAELPRGALSPAWKDAR